MHDKVWLAFCTAGIRAKNEDAGHDRLLRPPDVEIATEPSPSIGLSHVRVNWWRTRSGVDDRRAHTAAVDDARKICGLMHGYGAAALERSSEAVVQSLIV
jgi:hypothetical protein